MGLLVGTFFYPVISTTKRHRLIMWSFRLVALPLAIVLYVVLVRNFYTSDPYSGSYMFVQLNSEVDLLHTSLFRVSLSVLLPVRLE